jgi:hypothetical protein
MARARLLSSPRAGYVAPTTTRHGLGTSKASIYYHARRHLQVKAGFSMLELHDGMLTYERFGRCVQLQTIDYVERLRAALTRYSAEVARIVADRPLELEEAYRLAVRCGLVERR